jgi:hypothetical protein
MYPFKALVRRNFAIVRPRGHTFKNNVRAAVHSFFYAETVSVAWFCAVRVESAVITMRSSRLSVFKQTARDANFIRP